MATSTPRMVECDFTQIISELLDVLFLQLHAPTSSTQKVKLVGKSGQYTYTSTLSLTWRLPRAAHVDIVMGYKYFNLFNRARQYSNSRPLALITYRVACTKKFNPKA
jgi:hypothetical protein